MNNKKTIARVGNFIVTKENGNGMDWVSIKAVSGFWTMRFRQDNMMFRMVNEMAGDENLHAYLESWVKMCYLMSNCMPEDGAEIAENVISDADAMAKEITE